MEMSRRKLRVVVNKNGMTVTADFFYITKLKRAGRGEELAARLALTLAWQMYTETRSIITKSKHVAEKQITRLMSTRG